jgi:hypothetical protein
MVRTGLLHHLLLGRYADISSAKRTDLVSEYQQYQEASVDDEEGEEGVEEEQEVSLSSLSFSFLLRRTYS